MLGARSRRRSHSSRPWSRYILSEAMNIFLLPFFHPFPAPCWNVRVCRNPKRPFACLSAPDKKAITRTTTAAASNNPPLLAPAPWQKYPRRVAVFLLSKLFQKLAPPRRERERELSPCGRAQDKRFYPRSTFFSSTALDCHPFIPRPIFPAEISSP